MKVASVADLALKSDFPGRHCLLAVLNLEMFSRSYHYGLDD
jgi:hypothetical protein